MTTDRITKDTLRFLELLQHELAAFHGFRKLWADGTVSGKPRLPLDELVRDQAKQVHNIAYAALCAYQTVFPGRSPHAQFAYVRDFAERAESHVVQTPPRQAELMRINRQVAEQIMGWTWLAQRPDSPDFGPVYAIPPRPLPTRPLPARRLVSACRGWAAGGRRRRRGDRRDGRSWLLVPNTERFCPRQRRTLLGWLHAARRHRLERNP